MSKLKRLRKLLVHHLLRAILIILCSVSLILLLIYAGTGIAQKQRFGIDTSKSAIELSIDWCMKLFEGNLHITPHDYDLINNGIIQSSIIVSLSMVLSLIFSLAIAIVLARFRDLKVTVIFGQILYFTGAVPIFLSIVIVLDVVQDNIQLAILNPLNYGENLHVYLFAAAILSVGSGIMGELVRLFKLEMTKLSEEPFIQAARLRNASVLYHSVRAAIVPLSSALFSKIPFFIGAALIVEIGLGIRGVAYWMKSYADDLNIDVVILLTLIVVVVVVMFQFLNSLVIELLDPRYRNQQQRKFKPVQDT